MNEKENKNYEPHPDEAWSWEPAAIPYPIERMERKNGDIWYYFHDENGDLFYHTAKDMKFAARMEAATKKLQEKRR